jgi:hypothetical protein
MNIEQGRQRHGLIPTPTFHPEVPRDRQGRARWSLLKDQPQKLQEIIVKQANIFLEEEGDISQGLLRARRMSNFTTAIRQYYPGGFSALKRDLFDPQQIQEPNRVVKTATNVPVVDRSGVFIDEDEERWIVPNVASREFGVGLSWLSARMDRMRQMVGRNRAYRLTVLLNETDLAELQQGYVSLPRVDKKTKTYTDEGGQKWTSTSNISKTYGVSINFLKPLLSEVSFIPGRDSQGHEITLYSLIEAETLLDIHLSLPQVDKRTDAYTDETGEKWIIAWDYAKKLGIDRVTLLAYLKDAATIPGRNKTNQKVVLYKESDVLASLGNRVSLPRADIETGEYIDDLGQVWVSSKILQTRLNLHEKTIKKLAGDMQTCLGRDRSGKITTLYCLQEVEEKVKDFSSLPRVNKDSRYYIDANGISWASMGTLISQFGQHDIYKRTINSVQSIEGRSRSGQVVTLYRVDQIRQFLHDFIELPQVDKSSREYMDPEGEAWVVPNEFIQRMGLSNKSFIRLRKSLRSLRGRGGNGRVTTLYNKEDILSGFANDTQKEVPDRKIDPDEANQDLDKLLEN